ncbi:MAG: 1-acyl-sn-glycerol-3-phosphate acyltransferase [Saprospiraceae bacterium]|nr:1-acyl-sn-glycerol-3-phosphate acyltransferase [Saprospiraceae bacterium]
MFSRISALILRLWGWKITGQYPAHLDKVVVIAAPHTSNWDFPLGVLVNSAVPCHANYVGKHTLFRWPFGILFRWLGGIPVDRSRKTGGHFVDAIVAAFHREPRMHLVIAPEGTRSKVSKFKTGFYHIARQANVPICLCTFDWAKKEVCFDPQLFYPGNDEDADIEYLWNYYKGVKGAVPENGID